MRVYFNHKSEYQRGWCYCALTAIISLILITSSLFSETNVEESIHKTIFYMIEFIAGCTLQIVTVILVTESFNFSFFFSFEFYFTRSSVIS